MKHVNLSQIAANYRMLGVLLLLCTYYSFATLKEQQPQGPVAAKSVFSQIRQSAPTGAAVLIIAKADDASAQFAETLETALKPRGYTVHKAVGEPRDARLALEKLNAAGQRIPLIATTPDCARWKVIENLSTKYSAFSGARILTPQPYRWPDFLKLDNLLNIANQITVVAIIAAGMTLVIITGGIDLSVGSLVALSAVVATLLIRDRFGGTAATSTGILFGSSVAVLACAVVGLFSGSLVTFFRLPPFIATLGMMQVASGLAYILAKGASIYELPDSFAWLGRGIGYFNVPHAILLMIAVYAVTHFTMRFTKLGRYIYAVGGNREAARLSGVNVGFVLLLVYTLSGLSAGLGGVLLASQLKSGAPTYGLMYELYVIAAVVVGGTSLAGGEGRVFGTLVGALIIAVIQNGMNLTGVESYTQKIVLGAVILAAVLFDMLRRRGT